jgi:hypothetical protein
MTHVHKAYEYKPEPVGLKELIRRANIQRLIAEEKLLSDPERVNSRCQSRSEYDYAWAHLRALQELELLHKRSDRPFDTIIGEFIRFSTCTFQKATARSSLKKLNRELKELRNAQKDKDPALLYEFVDVFMCLIDAASRSGITINEFVDAFDKKLFVNQNRTWVRNPDNTYSHIKQQ